MALDSDECEDGQFDDQRGLNLTWECHGTKYLTVEDLPREVKLEISTWTTYDRTATHYYARMLSYNVHSKVLETTDEYTKVGEVSSVSHNNLPKESKHIEIRVTRRITKVEKHLNGEVIGRIGDYTECFNSKEDAIQMSIKQFKRIFKGRWSLHLKYDKEPIATTH